ncbi:MAG: hypothetical protein JO290_13495 [Sphingomonadaceae bacterium]|nr:hypothetical protein [Sphingomonadaceae bacterium]
MKTVFVLGAALLATAAAAQEMTPGVTPGHSASGTSGMAKTGHMGSSGSSGGENGAMSNGANMTSPRMASMAQATTTVSDLAASPAAHPQRGRHAAKPTA